MRQSVARFSLFLLLVSLASPALCRAEIVYVGVFSYNTFIPGFPDSPGINSFAIANLTGDPAAGGFALPPDFPVSTMLRFLDSRLSVVTNGTTDEFLLGDIEPGFFDSAALYFSDTTPFSSARFTATLSQSSFDLWDGRTFTADSDLLDIVLSPSNGTALTPDLDSQLIGISGTAVPEPSQVVPLVVMLTALLAFSVKRKNPG